jgi:dimethylargininase
LFKNAIVRLPAPNFADGLTTGDLGVPHFETVLEQHARYCDALRECGLHVTTLEADTHYPDSTFVEDTAVLTERGAILTRPGAASREGEVAAIRAEIAKFFPSILAIEAPGNLDGGDICEAGDHFFIGVSHRTNEEGARQLGFHLSGMGYTHSVIDIRLMTSILHLKSGISYIGENMIVLTEEMAGHKALLGYQKIVVSPEESYAANCVRVNDRVLMADGFPSLQRALAEFGFRPLVLEMAEFRKMDGGLSCLSLRLPRPVMIST